MSWAFIAACRRATTRSPIVPASESALGEPTLGVCLGRPARGTASAPVGPPRPSLSATLHRSVHYRPHSTDLLRPLGPDPARDPRAPRRAAPPRSASSRSPTGLTHQRDPEARRDPRARRPRRHREGRACAPLPARVRRASARRPSGSTTTGGPGRAGSIASSGSSSGGRGRRVSLDLRFERLIAAPPERRLRRLHRPRGPARVLRPGRRRVGRRFALRPARRRRLVDLVRPGARPSSITTITSSRRSSGRAGS